jgi:hypothetical protein
VNASGVWPDGSSGARPIWFCPSCGWVEAEGSDDTQCPSCGWDTPEDADCDGWLPVPVLPASIAGELADALKIVERFLPVDTSQPDRNYQLEAALTIRGEDADQVRAALHHFKTATE